MSDKVKALSNILDRVEKIGYGHPPVATRFQPGVSGNPNGRPKKVESLAATFRRIATSEVNYPIAGEPTAVSAVDLVIRKMFERAFLKEDPEAARLMLAMAREFLPQIDDDDRNATPALSLADGAAKN